MTTQVTGPEFRLGPGLPILILESDHSGSSFIIKVEQDYWFVNCSRPQEWIEQEPLTQIAARLLAAKFGKTLGF